MSNTLNVIFSGQLRGFKHVFDHNLLQFKNLCDDINFSFYLTNQDTENLPKKFKDDAEFEDGSIFEEINKYKNLNMSGISTYSADAGISLMNNYVQSDNITGFLLQWHGVKKSFNLFNNREGFYIRCRPDMRINNFNKEWLDVLDDNTIIIPWESYDGWFCDKLAIGNHKTMSIYCDFINHFHSNDGNSEERLNLYLKNNNINVIVKNLNFELVNTDGTIRR